MKRIATVAKVSVSAGLLGLLTASGSASLAYGAKPLVEGRKNVVRIEVGEEASWSDRNSRNRRVDEVQRLRDENRDLHRRVRRLEQAVRQLQDDLYDGGSVVIAQPLEPDSAEYTCYIKTDFKGTVYGKGKSETEAKAKTLKACDDADAGFSCNERNLRCGS